MIIFNKLLFYFYWMLKDHKKIYVYMLMGYYLCAYILMGDYICVYMCIYANGWLYIFTVCLKYSKILIIVYLFAWYLFYS